MSLSNNESYEPKKTLFFPVFSLFYETTQLEETLMNCVGLTSWFPGKQISEISILSGIPSVKGG